MEPTVMKKKICDRRNSEGIALLLTMGILLLLTILALGFSSSQLTENEAARNFYYAAKAEELALGGLDAATAVLTEDARANSYDHLLERWAILYAKDDGFAGNDDEDADLSDLDELENGRDPTARDDSMPDSRWMKVLIPDPGTGKDRLIGRYAVCIEDENSKVNINTAGNPEPESSNWRHRSNMGFTTAEIDLGTIMERLGKLYTTAFNAPSRYPDNVGNETALDLVTYRYGWSRAGSGTGDTKGVPGRKGDDNFTNQMPPLLRQDLNGIDDDGDKLIDEPGEEMDEPGEFSPYDPMAIDPPAQLSVSLSPPAGVTGVMGNDTPYLTVSHIRMANRLFGTPDNSISDKNNNRIYRALLPFVTVYSQDLNMFSGEDVGRRGGRTGSAWMMRENIGKWLDRGPSEIEKFLGDPRLGISYSDTRILKQIAVNIFDFLDPDWIPTKYGDVVGIEPTLYLNEVEPTPMDIPGELVGIKSGGPGKEASIVRDYGEYIELWNPYDVPLDVANYYVTIGPGSRMERIGAMASGSTTVVPARGFFVIGDTLGDVYYIGGASPDLDYTPPTPWPQGCQAYGRLKLAPSQTMVLEIRFGRRGGQTIEKSDYSLAAGSDNLTAQKDDPRIWEWRSEANTFHSMNANMTNQGNVYSYFYMPGVRSRANDPNYDPRDTRLLEHAGGLSNIGELGMVHRGEKWRSLNFAGEGTDKDDVKLLDFLSMPYPYRNEALEKKFGTLPAPEVVAGRININTATPEILMGLNWAPVMDELQSNGVRTSYAPMINYIVTNRPYRNLADVATVIAQLPALQNAPEAAREAFMKYNANLITTKSSVFKVTVLAEVFDRRGNVAASRKLEAVVDRGYTPGSLGGQGEPTPTRDEQARAKTARVLYFRWITDEW